MSVGVGKAGITVGGTAVNVGGTDVCAAVGGEDVGVDKTSTEKVQAASSSALNTKTIIVDNHLRHFIAFSLSAVICAMESPIYHPAIELLTGVSGIE
jgi:hypothetical protein